MYQQVTLVGNLGSDPEMRYTPSGVPVASFRMAVNKSWTGDDGQRQDKTTWFRVTAWRKLAETVSQYLTKGAKVLVVGEIEDARPYTDREGNLRATLEVTAQVVRFLNTRGEGQMMSEPGGNFAHANNHAGGDQHEVRDEDIPF
jgi:single-strand DNA-binding protein